MKKTVIILSAFLFCACGISQKKTAEEVVETGFDADKTLEVIVEAGFSDGKTLKEVILNQLQLKLEDCYKEFIVRKDIPQDDGILNENLSAWIIPKIAVMDEDGFSLDAYILIVNNDEGKIVNKFYKPYAWNSDAIRLSDLSIDDRVLYLNDSTWAISVTDSYTGSSQPYPFSSTTGSLYVPQGESLQPVFSYTVSDLHGEWDTRCNGQFESQETELVLSDKKTNGFNDIILQITIKHEVNTLVGEDCQESITYSDSVAYFQFTGKEYREAAFDVIWTKRETDGSEWEFCFFHNKTWEQVYEALIEKAEYVAQVLLPTLPAEDTKYETKDGDDDVSVSYTFIEKKHLLIQIEYEYGGTEIEINETEKNIQLSIFAHD